MRILGHWYAVASSKWLLGCCYCAAMYLQKCYGSSIGCYQWWLLCCYYKVTSLLWVVARRLLGCSGELLEI